MSHKKAIFVISFLSVFGFIFNFNVSPTKAATAVELQVLIQQLQAQIQILQQQLAQLQGQEETWCHNFNVNLKIGDSGDEVAQLHTALQKNGVWNVIGFSNTNFDEETASYVVAFQEKYASEILTPWSLKHGTGYVGKTTLAKLNQLYACRERSITLTSPNGGEKWTVGETHNITWEAEGIGSVNLYLEIPGDCVNDEFDNPICYPGTSYDIATSVSASSGSYSWTIPSRGISTGDSSVVKVEDADSDTFDVSDDYFSILPSSTYYFNGLDLEVKSMENQLASIAAFLSQLLNEIRELMDR